MKLDFTKSTTAEIDTIYGKRDDVIVFYNTTTNEFRHIELPQHIAQSEIFQALSKYSKTSEFGFTNDKELEKSFNALAALVSFFDYSNSNTFGVTTQQSYLNYLLEIKGNSSSTSVTKSNKIRYLFAQLGEYIYATNPELGLTIRNIFGPSNAIKRHKNQNKFFWNVLQIPTEGDTHDSLEILHPELELTNRQILSELREFSIDVLNAYHNLRSNFKNTDTYRAGLSFIAEHSMSQLMKLPTGVDFIARSNRNVLGHNPEVWEGLYRLQCNMYLSLENDLMHFLTQTSMQTNRFKRLLDSDEFGSGSLRGFISAVLNTNFRTNKKSIISLPTAITRTIDGKSCSYRPSLPMPHQLFRAMFEPAADETLAMFYLYGSKRAQQGTISDTHRDNLTIDKKSVVLDCYKNRMKDYGTPSFVKPDRAYYAIKNYYSDVDDVLQLDGFDVTERSNVLPQSGTWMLGKETEPLWYYLGQNVHTKFTGLDLTSYPQLSLLLQKVTNSTKSTLALRAVNSSAQKVSGGSKSFAVKDDFSELTTSGIDEDAVRRRASNNFHSVATQQNVYDNRSNDKINLETVERFAAQVGEEMLAKAAIISEAKSKSAKQLTLREFRQLIGLEGNLSAENTEDLGLLAREAKALGYIQDEAGIFSASEETVIIVDERTAFLLEEHAEHLEREAVQQFECQRHDSALKLLAHLLMLREQLSRFPESTKRVARERYQHLKGKIPFSKIEGGL